MAQGETSSFDLNWRFLIRRLLLEFQFNAGLQFYFANSLPAKKRWCVSHNDGRFVMATFMRVWLNRLSYETLPKGCSSHPTQGF